MTTSLRDRVINGALVLDHLDPLWFTKINLSSLDVGRYDRCVLGQLYGDYADGLDDIAGPDREAYAIDANALGFNTSFAIPGGFEQLTAEWVSLIQARLDEAREVHRERALA